jgi:hypothetical protein
MDYWGSLAAVNPAGRILIVNGGNAVACLACAFIARARKQPYEGFATFPEDGRPIGGQAGYEISQIINADVKDSQADAVRRRPYFGRDRYSAADYWVRGRY